MLDQDTLQQLGVKPAGAFDKIVKVISVLLQVQVIGGVAQLRMMVNQERLSPLDFRQQGGQVRGHRRNSRSSFGAQEAEDLPPASFASVLHPRPGQGIEQRVAIQRFQKIFGAPASHRLHDELGLGVVGNCENNGLPELLVNPLGGADCSSAVSVEIN